MRIRVKIRVRVRVRIRPRVRAWARVQVRGRVRVRVRVRVRGAPAELLLEYSTGGVLVPLPQQRHAPPHLGRVRGGVRVGWGLGVG